MLVFFVAAAAPILAQDSTTVEIHRIAAIDDTTAMGPSRYQEFKSNQFDSTLIQGSAYGSFADIFDRLPGTYWFDRGSVGQLAEGFLFGGKPSSFMLDYDGLVLNGPLTGKVNLNLVPVESINTIGLVLSSVDRNSVFNPVGQTLQINSVDLAALPIRSRVAYRTGTGYDDNDVRLGIQVSPALKMNIGGILKNYAGTQFHSKYRAQKINVKIDRTIFKNWYMRYVLLYNKYDLDIPYLENYNVPGEFRLPHQKDNRYDHGLFLKRGNFKSTLQYVNLMREYYGYRHSVVDQLHDVNSVRLENEYLFPMPHFDLGIGSRWNWIRLESNEWGDHVRWEAGGVLSINSMLGKNKLLSGQVLLNKTRNYNLSIQPQVNLSWLFSENLKILAWYLRQDIAPSLERLYTNGPFVSGNRALKPETIDNIGITVQGESPKYTFFLSHSLQDIKNIIVISPDNNAVGPSLTAPAFFSNIKNIQQYVFDIQSDYRFYDWLSLVSKVKCIYQFNSNEYTINLPDYFAKFYISLHKNFARFDLDTTIRLGGEIVGPFKGANPYWENPWVYSENTNIQFFPHIHAIFKIGDITLFAALLNPLNMNYQRIYNLPHPKTQLRWGFSWNFID